ncbi:MFS transporter [Streptomyces sp. SID486]|uniref:MFS transporter n=1 Tax=unclassified Streptomyces TaxID=2593676 RepID=UPI0013714477|nr:MULTISPECIES: MFS transporter [unclassified Streptomyces]MYW47379.1 MFS transporter [Streptomyces sp. SID161]MYX96617.1 MFS transporter [Streptomyces sp. SID486]
MTSPTPVAAGGADPRRWRALAVLLTASLIDVIDVTIVNITMPTIRKDIDASYSALQWVSAGYALTFAVGLITGGRLGDIYGRKRVFLIGIGGFTLASTLCGLAGDPGLLIAARVLQGACAALMVPQVLSTIHVTFPMEERGKVFGLFGSVIGLGAVLGPLVGAVLTEGDVFGLSWRAVFLLNLPIGLAGLLFGMRLIGESKAPQALRLDPVGIVLASAALLMLLVPLTRGHELGWPAWTFVLMAASLAVFAGFVLYERAKSRRDGSPLVELSLFRVRSFAAGIGIQLAVSMVCGVFLMVWTLHLQLGLGYSPLKTGLTGTPNAIATSVAAAVAMQKLAPYGRKVLQAGALIMAGGAALYALEARHYGAGMGPWAMVLPLAVMGAGTGLMITPLTGAVLSQVPFQHAGSASGLINTTNQLGIALGLGLSSVTFFDVLEGAGPGTAPAAAFTDAFVNSLWWVVGGLGIAFLLMLALPRLSPPPAGMMPAADEGEAPVTA